MKVKTFYNIEPIIKTKIENGREFGLHRDRKPDNGWDEWRWSVMDERVKEVELTPVLYKILIEDICDITPNNKIFDELKEYIKCI